MERNLEENRIHYINIESYMGNRSITPDKIITYYLNSGDIIQIFNNFKVEETDTEITFKYKGKDYIILKNNISMIKYS